MLIDLTLTQFTGFSDGSMTLSPNLNVLIGDHASGKTHLLKVLFSACLATHEPQRFAHILTEVFRPRRGEMGRLVTRASGMGKQEAHVQVRRRGARAKDICELNLTFSNRTRLASKAVVSGDLEAWGHRPLKTSFLPTQDLLAIAPLLHDASTPADVDRTWTDTVAQLYREPLQKRPLANTKLEWSLHILERIAGGKLILREAEWLLRQHRAELEVSLSAEGRGSLAALQRLIANGSLDQGSVLFWEHPERQVSTLDYWDLRLLIMHLLQCGIQLFISTHDPILAEALDGFANQYSVRFHHCDWQPSTASSRLDGADRFEELPPNFIERLLEDAACRELINRVAADDVPEDEEVWFDEESVVIDNE